jgi:hypothetical protein
MAIILKNPAKSYVRFGPEVAAGKWALPGLYLLTWGGPKLVPIFRAPKLGPRQASFFCRGLRVFLVAGGVANNYVEGKFS